MRQRRAVVAAAGLALAASLAGLSQAQQGQPESGAQPGANQSGAQPGAGLPAPLGLPPQPGGPSNQQLGTGADPFPQPVSPPAAPGGINAPGPGAPGQPGGAPACPAENPACNPMNPNSPTEPRASGAPAGGAQNRRADADGRLTSRVRESLLQGGVVGETPNLSVTTRAGRVTLRGVVRSEAERQEIGRRAEAVAGRENVVNELTVAP